MKSEYKWNGLVFCTFKANALQRTANAMCLMYAGHTHQLRTLLFIFNALWQSNDSRRHFSFAGTGNTVHKTVKWIYLFSCRRFRRHLLSFHSSHMFCTLFALYSFRRIVMFRVFLFFLFFVFLFFFLCLHFIISICLEKFSLTSKLYAILMDKTRRSRARDMHSQIYRLNVNYDDGDYATDDRQTNIIVHHYHVLLDIFICVWNLMRIDANWDKEFRQIVKCKENKLTESNECRRHFRCVSLDFDSMHSTTAENSFFNKFFWFGASPSLSFLSIRIGSVTLVIRSYCHSGAVE